MKHSKVTEDNQCSVVAEVRNFITGCTDCGIKMLVNNRADDDKWEESPTISNEEGLDLVERFVSILIRRGDSVVFIDDDTILFIQNDSDSKLILKKDVIVGPIALNPVVDTIVSDALASIVHRAVTACAPGNRLTDEEIRQLEACLSPGEVDSELLPRRVASGCEAQYLDD